MEPTLDNNDMTLNTSSHKQLSVIIVNYNSFPVLVNCLRSVEKECAFLQHEVIIVDNNSSDRSRYKIAEKYPDLVLIANAKNVGFSKANNQALEIARGEYILFLNPDTELLDGAGVRLVQHLGEHPECVAVGPVLFNPGGMQWDVSGRKLPNLWYELCRLFFLDRLFFMLLGLRVGQSCRIDEFQAATEVECLSGAALMVRGQAVSELGGFDEAVPLFLDDVDLCARLGKFGSLAVIKEARVLHHHNVSGRSQPARVIQEIALQAHYVYLRKHRGTVPASLFSLLVLIRGSLQYLAFSLLRLALRTATAKYRLGEAATMLKWALGEKERTYSEI